jgi:hypothetical protein
MDKCELNYVKYNEDKSFECFRINGEFYTQNMLDNDYYAYDLWIWIPAGFLIFYCACICCIICCYMGFLGLGAAIQ